MKKTIKILIITLIFSLFLLQGTVHAFEINMNTEKNILSAGEEFVYTINLSNSVVATNFNINYDSTSLELVGAVTQGLAVSKKDGKIACIYADINGIGTNKFQIKFKVKNIVTSKTLAFSLDDAKFRASGEEQSYTGTQIGGLNSVTNVKVEENGKSNDSKDIQSTGSIQTNSENNNAKNNVKNKNVIAKESAKDKKTLPKAGAGFMLVFTIMIFIIIGTVFGIKGIRLKDIPTKGLK